MEDSFKLRVDKIFGSLSSTSSSSSSSSSLSSSSPALSSLWSLTDDEIEKREWDRDKGSPEPESTPYPSNLDGFFSNQQELQRRRTVVSEDKSLKFSAEIEEDLEDLDDEVDDDADVVSGSSKQPAKPDDHDDEEWQIRSSVGSDPTLDYEDEEDEFDKVAVGRENAGDRVYMSKLNDYGTCSNSYNELPISFNEAVRDSRANLMAAKLRLKQDAEAAGSFDSLTVYDKAQFNTATDVSNLKSILKRKENPSDSKLQKRVRFDSECKNDFQEEFEKANENAKETCPMEEGPVSNEASLVPQDHNPSVPDYLRNPSKYTCYTFDDSSTEVDEESNRRAYMDFLNLVRKSNTMEAQPDDASVDLPKSVTFTPRKKTGDATAAKNTTDSNRNEEDAGKGPTQKKGFPVSIAAVEVEGSEVCAMDEDEPETVAENSNSSRKSGRQYRSKVRSELDHIP